MSAQPLPAADVPTVTRRRTLASVEAGTTLRSKARTHVTDVLRLVALSLDANASSGTAREQKYATLRVLVAEVAATASTATSPEVAAELAELDIEAGLTLGADRVVALVKHALAPEDVAAILREVVTTRWADGSRLQCDPAVALTYASRLLAPATSYAELAELRRPGLLRRVLGHRAPVTPVRHLQPVAPAQPTWRAAGDPVVPGVLYLPLAAQAAAQRELGVRPFTAVDGDCGAA